jgi:hypothetical protein
MVGGRRTHTYPHGKPFPLVLIENLLMAIVVVCWIFLAARGWRYILGILAVFVALAAIDWKVTAHYERIGLAVRIPRNSTSPR